MYLLHISSTVSSSTCTGPPKACYTSFPPLPTRSRASSCVLWRPSCSLATPLRRWRSCPSWKTPRRSAASCSRWANPRTAVATAATIPPACSAWTASRIRSIATTATRLVPPAVAATATAATWRPSATMRTAAYTSWAPRAERTGSSHTRSRRSRPAFR